MNEITIRNEVTVETSFGKKLAIIGEASGFPQKGQNSLFPDHHQTAEFG